MESLYEYELNVCFEEKYFSSSDTREYKRRRHSLEGRAVTHLSSRLR